MRKSLIITFLLFFSYSAGAQEVSSLEVASGIWHRVFSYEDGPWAINVVEVDLTDSNITIESAVALNRLTGLQRTSSMANRRSRVGSWVAAAINADFFERNGVSINVQVQDGKILRMPSNHSIIGFYEDLSPFIEMPSYSGSVIAMHNRNRKIDAINQKRNADQLVLFNRFYGDSTKTNSFGAEICFMPVEGWAVNDTFRIVVMCVDSTDGNHAIDARGGVLSGHGEARSWLQNETSLGDTLKLILSLTNSKKRIKEAVGGLPRIIRDGKTSIEGGSGFASVRHPRTGAGFSQDGTRLFLFTVDGRQAGHSDGMTLYEMADFMLGLGVYQGINLDGGGSTTMVIGSKVVNRPSDATGERPVANGLLVISKEPPNSATSNSRGEH
jgi:hypothetical protein